MSVLRSATSKRPGAVEILVKSSFAASSSRDVNGSIASEVPTSAAWQSTAIGSSPASRKLCTDRAPKRFDSAWPSAPTSSEWCPNASGVAPSASKIAICTPVLVTWSSPRTTCVMAKSMSSTTLVNVYRKVPSSRISTGSESDPSSTVWSPRTRSFQETSVGSGARLPPSGSIGQAEPPIRSFTRRQFRVDVLLRQFESGAIVDRRPVHRELAFPAAVELVLGLEARIEHAASFQGLCRIPVERRAILLPRLLVPREAEPRQIIADGLGELLCRACHVSVVEPQQKRAVILPGKKPIQRGGSDVANMESPGWARGKTDAWSHYRSFHGLRRAAPYPATRRWQGLCLVLAFLGRR